MAPRLSSKPRKQTRLTFTPVPSSSPRSEAHVRIGDLSTPSKRPRLEFQNVDSGLDASPSQKSTVRVVIPSPKHQFLQLPTPAASSQLEAGTPTRKHDAPTTSEQTVSRSTVRGHTEVVAIDTDSEEEAPFTSTQRRRPLFADGNARLSSSDDSEPVAAARSSRKRADIRSHQIRQRRQTSTPPFVSHCHHTEKDSDVEADVEDLKDTEVRERRTRGSQPQSERSKRLNKLEELKRRRAGITISESDDEDEGSIGSGEDTVLAAVGANEYDSDFVEDDGALGISLAQHGVDLRLTSQANKKPFEYFKDEIDWMIHNKLDPAFDRNDEVYNLAHWKLNDEVQGHAGSTFKSAAWRQDFLTALQTRPDLRVSDYNDGVTEKCDACGRSKHPPRHRITFTGPVYDKQTLEKISSHDDDDQEEELSEDSNSSSQTAEDIHFLVGRFCCANAQISHTLYHWRYQLNGLIHSWLEANGHTSPAKIVARENWSRHKREKLANKIVDGMAESGELKDLYRMFKQNLEAARSAKPEGLHWRK